MSAESLEPYEALAALIERELQLVSERSFDELQTLKEVRTELQRSLPAAPPEAARATLERCRQLQKRVEIELLRVRELLLLDLGRVRQAQRTADGYAPPRQRTSVVAATAWASLTVVASSAADLARTADELQKLVSQFDFS